MSNFLWIPGAHLSLGPAIGTGHEARARILFRREPVFQSMRKGEPKTSLGPANRHSTRERMLAHPELTHATITPIGTPPVSYPLPCNQHLIAFPVSFASIQLANPIQGGWDARTLASDRLHNPMQRLRVGDSWVCALSLQEIKTVSRGPRFVGAWGKSVPGKLAF